MYQVAIYSGRNAPLVCSSVFFWLYCAWRNFHLFSDLSLSGIQNTNTAFLYFSSLPTQCSISSGNILSLLFGCLYFTQVLWWSHSPRSSSYRVRVIYSEMGGEPKRLNYNAFWRLDRWLCEERCFFLLASKLEWFQMEKKSVSMPTLAWLISFTEKECKNSIKRRGT